MKIKRQINPHGLSSMKILLFTLAILLSCSCVWAQEKETKSIVPVHNLFEDYKRLSAHNNTEIKELSDKKSEPAQNAAAIAAEDELEKARVAPVEAENEPRGIREKDTDEADIEDILSGENLSKKDKEKFHWKPALIQSGILLAIQHGFRMTQAKTTRELGGPFFRDWAQSVKNLRGWKDGDSSFTNYTAHPLQGGVTGRIFINNSDAAKKQEFGKSKKYWESRFKTMAWSAVWSTQFELGPISEANLGNVGLNERRGHSTMAWVDLVVTPVVGTGVVIAEDAIDKYILRNWLERKAGKATTKIKIVRTFLTPTTSFSNLLRGKMPWSRDNR